MFRTIISHLLINKPPALVSSRPWGFCSSTSLGSEQLPPPLGDTLLVPCMVPSQQMERYLYRLQGCRCLFPSTATVLLCPSYTFPACCTLARLSSPPWLFKGLVLFPVGFPVTRARWHFWHPPRSPFVGAILRTARVAAPPACAHTLRAGCLF